MKIQLQAGDLTSEQQAIVTRGFEQDSQHKKAPQFKKERITFKIETKDHGLIAILTGDILWDWLYVDELWVAESMRGQELGKGLMVEAESYANKMGFNGIYLWTQSWQAPAFYKKLGYVEFATLQDFPKGHSRIGFKKELA